MRVTAALRIVLAISHLVVPALLWLAVAFCVLIAFSSSTPPAGGPGGLRAFVVGVMRWSGPGEADLWLLPDRYPPFRLG